MSLLMGIGIGGLATLSNQMDLDKQAIRDFNTQEREFEKQKELYVFKQGEDEKIAIAAENRAAQAATNARNTRYNEAFGVARTKMMVDRQGGNTNSYWGVEPDGKDGYKTYNLTWKDNKTFEQVMTMISDMYANTQFREYLDTAEEIPLPSPIEGTSFWTIDYVKRKQSTDPKGDTYAVAVTNAKKLQVDLGLDDLGLRAVPVGSDAVGWKVEIKSKSAKKDDKPTLEKDPANNLELSLNYYFAKHPKSTGVDAAASKGYGLYFVDAQTPFSINNKAMMGVNPNTDYYVTRPPVENASDSIRQFVSDMPPEAFRNLKNNNSGGGYGYADARADLKARAVQWYQQTKGQTTDVVTYEDLMLEFNEELSPYLTIDPGLTRVLGEALDTAHESTIRETSGVANAPLAYDEETKRAYYDAQTFDTLKLSPTIVVQKEVPAQTGTGTEMVNVIADDVFQMVMTQAGVQNVANPRRNAEKRAINIFSLFANAYDVDREANTATLSPELGKESFGNLVTVLGKLEYGESPVTEGAREQVVSSVGLPIPGQATEISDNLAPFVIDPKTGYPNFVGAVKAIQYALPQTTRPGERTRASLKKLGPQGTFDAIVGGGGPAFREIGAKTRSANKTMMSALKALKLMDEGARVPGPAPTIDRYIESFSYSVEEVISDIEARVAGGSQAESDAYTQQLRSDLRNEYRNALSMSATGDQEKQRKLDALLKFHLKVISYSFARLLDENGRLSNEDREQTDDAIGTRSLITAPDLIQPVVQELYGMSAYQFALGSALTSMMPQEVLAGKILEQAYAGRMLPTKPAEIISSRLQAERETQQITSTNQAVGSRVLRSNVSGPQNLLQRQGASGQSVVTGPLQIIRRATTQQQNAQ